MSSFRSFLFLAVISLSLALALLFYASVTEHVEYRGGYAVLETDASMEDAALLELLNEGGNSFGGEFVCESSQWVLLDEFGSLRMIPLPQYGARLFPFDPRNDGYAEKLKNIFVRDGKRFVYIPVKAGNGALSLDKQLNALLGDISFSVNYFGIGRRASFFFLAYAAAAVLLIIICYVKRNTHRGAVTIPALLPVLSPLAFFGAGGIAAAALLMGFFVMLREPAGEIVAGKARGLQHGLYWLFLPVFALVFAAVVVFLQLKPLFMLAVFAAACIVFFFSIKPFSLPEGWHRRFTPVPIIRKKLPDFAFPLYMLPLAAAALFVILFGPYMSGVFASGAQFDHIVEESDYYAHLEFQSSFSTRQLGDRGETYSAYLSGEDGLPAPDMARNAMPSAYADEFPPFPLKHLMEFFNGVNSGAGAVPGSYGGGIAEKLSVLFLLIFVALGFFLKGKGNSARKARFSGLKRFSSNLRRTYSAASGADINRKKVLIYQRKDA